MLQLLNRFCGVSYYTAVLFSMVTAVYTAPWSLPAPPRVEVVSGLARQDNFVQSRRFREDGLEVLKLSTGGGARVNTLLGAPAVATQTKPINSDPLQVQVKRVVFTHPKETKRFRFWRPCGTILFLTDFHGQNNARGARFLLGFSMYLIVAQTDQV